MPAVLSTHNTRGHLDAFGDQLYAYRFTFDADHGEREVLAASDFQAAQELYMDEPELRGHMVKAEVLGKLVQV